MAKKEKDQPATITFEGKEYIIDDMSDTQKELKRWKQYMNQRYTEFLSTNKVEALENK